MKRLIFFFYSLIFCLSINAQSTTGSYTWTTRFFNNDFLQMYQGARLSAPTMTLPNSISTYTSTLPFVNTDNLQLYNAIRGLGDATSSFTNTSWNLTGNAISTNTNFIGTTTNRSLLFKANNNNYMKLDSTGVLTLTKPFNFPNNYNQIWRDGVIEAAVVTYTPTAYRGFWFGTTTNDNLCLATNINGGNVPMLVLSNQVNGGVLINPVSSTYTTNAILQIYHGGFTEAIRTTSANSAALFRVDNFGSLASRSLATIGSTVIASGQPTLNVAGTMSVSSTSTLNGLNLASGGFSVTSKTINTTAGDGATINSPIGRFRKDTSGNTFVLTNSFITANSIIVLTLGTTGVTSGYQLVVTPTAGSATITFETAGSGAAPNKDCDVNFIIMN